MATATAPCSTKIALNTVSVYLTAKGLKITSRGKVLSPLEACQRLSKSDRRRLRKILRVERPDLFRQTFPYQTFDPDVREAFAKLKRHYQHVRYFYADPMTDACPCVEDFQEDFERKERKLLGELRRAAETAGDKQAREIALDGFEKWMP